VISKPVSLFKAALEELSRRLWYFLYFFLSNSALCIFERLESTHKFYNKIIQLLSFREHLVFIYQLRIDRHARWGFFDLTVQKTNDDRLAEDEICTLRQKTHSMFYVLVICKVNLFWKEETFLHTYTEIGDPFHFFSLLTITNGKLWYPNAIDKLLRILYDVVEDEVQENEKLHSHQFVVFTISQKHLYLWDMSVQNINVLLRVYWRAKNQQFLFAVYTQKATVHQITRLHTVIDFRPHLKHW